MKQSADQPNILLITCDQLRADYLGCSGADFMKTPHLDRLAREGATGDWPATWFVFEAYALVVAVTFALVFRYRHRPEQLGTVNP